MPPIAQIDSVFAAYDSSSTPGCAVVVLHADSVIFRKAYGMAHIGFGVPMTTATTTWIPYSEARIFTALAVAMLARDGAISLDDPVRRHIADMPAYAGAVTIRQLIHHTSGLADYGVLDPGFDLSDRKSEDEVFRALTRWGALGFTPGRGSMYSNTDYALLRILVERVARVSLHEYLHQQLLTPLGMRSTRIGIDQGLVSPNHGLFHERVDGGWRNLLRYRISPVGGIAVTTSADDLARWARALGDPATGIGALLDTLERGAPASAGNSSFSFGVHRDTYEGLRVVHYHGVGDYKYLTRVPEANLSVATVCSAYAGTADFGPAVAALFVGGATPARPAMHAATLTPLGPTVAVPVAALQRYTGEYVLLNGRESGVRMDMSDSALVITLPNGRSFSTRSLGDGRFATELPGSGIVEFTFASSDSTPGGLLVTTREMASGEPAGPPLRRKVTRTVTAETMRGYVGSYLGDRVEATVHVTVQGGRLMIGARGLPVTELQPEPTADAFHFSLYGARFQRNAAGQVTHLTLDATRVKGMRYTRRR